MKEEKKGYWIYSCLAIILGMGLFAFIGYLIFNLIIRLSDKDFSNNTVVQALITLIITVFIGGYFSKWLEIRNEKKIELYKIQTSLSLKIIDLASEYYRNPNNEELKALLKCESCKVKLYFNESVLKALNEFIVEENKLNKYNVLVDELKKNIK